MGPRHGGLGHRRPFRLGARRRPARSSAVDEGGHQRWRAGAGTRPAARIDAGLRRSLGEPPAAGERECERDRQPGGDVATGVVVSIDPVMGPWRRRSAPGRRRDRRGRARSWPRWHRAGSRRMPRTVIPPPTASPPARSTRRRMRAAHPPVLPMRWRATAVALHPVRGDRAAGGLAAGGLLRRGLLGGGLRATVFLATAFLAGAPSCAGAFLADRLLGGGLLGRRVFFAGRLPVSTASLNGLSGVTRALRDALMRIASPVWGLRPMRAARSTAGELGEAADQRRSRPTRRCR